MKKGQHEQAVRDLTRSIRLNPKDSNPYVYRAQALRVLGEDDRADADLARARQLGYKPTGGAGGEGALLSPLAASQLVKR
jgi:Flp pilus assembly protein TadD